MNEKYEIDFVTLQECRTAFIYILSILKEEYKENRELNKDPVFLASDKIFELYENSFIFKEEPHE